MRKNGIFIAIILFIVTLLYMGSRKEFVPIPADKKHINITDKKICLDCHAPDKEAPLKKEHPPKDQCFECHK
ncbi:MAG: hypothetical protein HZA14_02285, partial [Nitrospirae bacterium]|nr:hypothetical protein [Nitrospirota bacterium]